MNSGTLGGVLAESVWMINILRETELRYLSQLLGFSVLSILSG